MKKLISTGLVIFILLTLSVSVYSYLPSNDISGYATLTSIELSDSNGRYYSVNPNKQFLFGTFNYISLYISNSTRVQDVNPIISIPITVEQSGTATVYIAVSPITSYFDYISPDLEQYRYNDGDFSVTLSQGTYNSFSGNYPVSSPSSFSLNTSSYSNSNSVTVDFICFKSVPGDSTTYLFSFFAQGDYSSSYTWIFPVGVFVSMNTVVDEYIDGSISFNDAIQSVYDDLESVLDSDISDSEKLIYIELANNDIERLKDISDIKYNSTVSNFNTNADEIIDDFVSGDVDVHEALSDIQLEYFDALSQAVTPEQGTYLNTSFQLKVDKLSLLWQVDFQQQLDEVVSDEKLDDNSEKLSALDKLYADEKEVLNHFELAEFESQLEFSLWTDTLPSDYANYKAIFEYFLEDNKAFQISQFLIVPFSLVLVSVLLATTTVILRRSRNG